MQHYGSHSAHSAEPSRRESGRRSSGSGNTLKFVLLGVVLLLIVAVLVLLFVRGCSSGSSEITDAAAAANLSSSVLVQDADGKDMGKNLTISAGTLAPADVNPADAVLLDITWDSSKSAEYPLILTVSDPSFVDGNGLIVFHYVNGQWVKVGTYTIANHSVTFLADSLSPFAFVPYEKYNTPTPTASATPLPSASPTPTASPSPSPSKSPSPSPTSSSTGTDSSYNYNPSEQYIDEGNITPIEEPDIQTDEDTGDDDGGDDDTEETTGTAGEITEQSDDTE